MIPIIFDSASQDFTSNGLGRLTDCISCLVTEERNGIYEVELEYPITGVNYDKIQQGNIIVVSHDEQKDRQPFIIYRVSKPISGIVTVNAHHISYRLTNVIVEPYTASNITDAMAGLSSHALTDNAFEFWTDIASASTFENIVPKSAKALLGGTKGSILDVYGGEYQFDNLTVRLYRARGRDNHVKIRYGKNLTDIVAETETLDIYNAVVPFWKDSDGNVVYAPVVTSNGGILRNAYWRDENKTLITDENGTLFDFVYYVRQTVVMDLSDEFDDAPTESQLKDRALQILNSNKPWIPKQNIKVDFIALWQTEEYKDVAPLERVRLCDFVTIEYPALGVEATAKVIKVVWDALTERYESIELGESKTSFAEVIMADTDEKLADVPTVSTMNDAIQHATDLITGGLGGHVVFRYDANGKPTEILIMDTDSEATAVHVLRMNVNGIGFSSTGVNGPYTSAWTLDGRFVADFITAGTMSANRIQGGTLTLGGADNQNGVLVLYTSDNVEAARMDRNGFTVYDGTLSGGTLTAGQIVSGTWYSAPSDRIGTVMEYDPRGDWSDMELRRRDASTGTGLRFTASSIAPFVTNTYGLSSENNGLEFVGQYVPNRSAGGTEEAVGFAGVWVGVERGNYIVTEISTTISEQGIHVRYGKSSSYPDICQIDGMDVRIGEDGSTGTNTTTINGYLNVTRSSTGSRSYELGMDSSYTILRYYSGSTKRVKHGITKEICDELSARRLYDLPVVQFYYNDDILDDWDERKGKLQIGFIAEDVDKIYPVAAEHDDEGLPSNWEARSIVPPMLKLIQEQHAEIESLKARLSELEKAVEKLMR